MFFVPCFTLCRTGLTFCVGWGWGGVTFFVRSSRADRFCHTSNRLRASWRFGYTGSPGPILLDPVLETNLPTHQHIDQRTRAMHSLIVAKIRHDPALFVQVLATLARWRGMVCGASQPHLQAWQALAQQGMEPCLQMATEDSERAAVLRQASPFAGMLTNEERFAFLKAWRREHAAP